MPPHAACRWIAAAVLLLSPAPLLLLYVLRLGAPDPQVTGRIVWLTAWALPFLGLASAPVSDRARIGLGLGYAPFLLFGMFVVAYASACGRGGGCF